METPYYVPTEREQDLAKLKRSLEQEHMQERASKSLAKSSKKLSALYEVEQLVFALEDGQSLVIDDQGRIFRGRVKTEKLHELPEKLPGKPSHDYVGEIQSKWLVSAPISTFTNSWDGSLKIPQNTKGILPSLFRTKFEQAKPETIHKHFIHNYHGHNMIKVRIDGVSIQGIFSKQTGVLKYIVKNGKEKPVYYDDKLPLRKTTVNPNL